MARSQVLYALLTAVATHLFYGCEDDSSVVLQADASQGRQYYMSMPATNYGAIHNAALEAVRTLYTPADVHSFDRNSAMAAYSTLRSATLAVIVQSGVETTGLSSFDGDLTAWFTGWWPDTVTREFSIYFTTLGYYNHPTAVARVVYYLDDTDPSTMTKVQYRNQLNEGCDSLLDALATKSAVASETAFVQIVKSSLDYWYTFRDPSWNGPVRDATTLAAFVQADCGGFLVGWATEAAKQVIANGTFTATVGGQMTPEEKRRISSGLVTAAVARCGGVAKMANDRSRWIKGLWK